MNLRSLVLLALLVLPRALRAEPTRTYVVKSGDTCLGIAARELGDKDQLAALHRLNPQLGRQPHKLVPGQVLTLPAGAKADANLTFQQGDVQVRRAGEEAWQHTPTGADLFRAWRVGSHERASAQVTFADRSVIGMRENTIVVIFGPSRGSAGVAPMRATLESGALRSKLADLDGPPVQVTTRSSVATILGSAVVEVAQTGATLVSNHMGKPAKVASRTVTRKVVKVVPGYGTKVAVGAEPATPTPLPPTPSWGAVPDVAIAWTGQPATLHAAWLPVRTAAKYRIELATDVGLTAVMQRIEAPATATALELRELPPGAYYLSVISVDAEGLESIPSPPRAVRVAALALPTGAAVHGDRVLVPLGGELVAPADTTCTLDGRAATPLVATAIGHHSLACRGRSTVASRLAIDVAAVRVTTRAPQIVAGGAPAWVDVELEGGVRPAGPLSLVGPAGLTLGAAVPTATGARFSVAAAPHASLGAQQLVLMVSIGGHLIEADRVPVVVRAR